MKNNLNKLWYGPIAVEFQFRFVKVTFSLWKRGLPRALYFIRVRSGLGNGIVDLSIARIGDTLRRPVSSAQPR